MKDDDYLFVDHRGVIVLPVAGYTNLFHDHRKKESPKPMVDGELINAVTEELSPARDGVGLAFVVAGRQVEQTADDAGIDQGPAGGLGDVQA